MARHYLGCQCPGKDRSFWRIETWRGNRSAFNGYRFTRSDYSRIVCLRCGTPWRTKAAYVGTLLMMTEDERLKHWG